MFLQAFLFQGFDKLLDGALIAAVGNQGRIAVVDDEEIFHADRGDEMAAVADDVPVGRFTGLFHALAREGQVRPVSRAALALTVATLAMVLKQGSAAM